MTKPKIHLICNAHLDPVWQWRWEEGCAEALATFRTAAKLLRSHPRWIFNHNEALLYRWVEKHDPDLFREIRALVREGRWCISGGWYLQPDANLPGLESFFRHIIEGRRYFKDRFDAEPRVAYNFDAFGHHGGLPQILRQTGYGMYIHMRPIADELTLPADLYRWRGVDGSEIPAYRIDVGLYHTERDNIENRLVQGTERALKLKRDVPVFWGLGNHGGGATREDLERIDAFMKKEDRVAILHSTPDRFLDSVKEAAGRAPVWEGDLQRAFTGCYTSLARLKARARRSLGRLVQAEALNAATWWLADAVYPDGELEAAWRDHLFNDFHDILPGTCTETAERDALDLYGRCAEETRRLRLEAATVLNRHVKKRARLPLTVMNTIPSLERAPVEVEFMVDYRPPWKEKDLAVRLHALDGTPIPCQEEQPEALMPFHDWRRKISFMADLPGLGAAHYFIEGIKKKEQDLSAPAWHANLFDDRSGRLLRFHGPGGMNCLAPPGLRFRVVRDEGDSWGSGCSRYEEKEGYFEHEGDRARPIERGLVRTIYESAYTYRNSRCVMQTIAYDEWPVLEFRLRLQWNEARKRLKMEIPTLFREGEVECEIPGGVIARPADGDEHVHGRWLMVRGTLEGAESALGIVHSGQHGFDCARGTLGLSVVRGAAYCHERGKKRDSKEWRFMDQGVHDIRMLWVAGTPLRVKERLASLADWLDAPPLVYAHLPFGPSSSSEEDPGDARTEGSEYGTRMELLALSPCHVRLAACRRAHDGGALILRLHETAGEACEAILAIAAYQSLPGVRQNLKTKLAFKPFEIKTLRTAPDGSITEVEPLAEGGPASA
jgi:alpha-mannosidase